MKSVKYFLILCLLFIIPINSLKAQYTNTLYFMDEVAERNNLNPALTPNCNFYFDFIVLPNLYLNVGNNNFTLKDLIYNQNGKATTFLSSPEAIDKFYNKLYRESTINANFRLNILSFGFQARKNYFTFDMGLQSDVSAHIPRDIFKLALYGTPDAEGVNTFDFSHLGVNATLYSNISLGYMYRINKKITVGAKVKFLMGYANVNTSINKLNLNTSRKEWSMETDGRVTASLPITFNTNEDGSIDFESLALADPSDLITMLYKPAGLGFAADLGIKYEPIKHLVLSASVTDLGFIDWSKNTFVGSMQGSHIVDNIIDYTVGDSLTLSEKVLGIGNEVLETIHVDEKGEPYRTNLRGNFFLAAEYGVFNNKISVGIMNRLSFKDNIMQDEATVALNLRPANWFKVTASYSLTNGRGGNMGLGLNLRLGMFNMYLIADYIPLTYTKLESQNLDPMISKIPIPNKSQTFNLQLGWSWNIGRHVNDSDHDGVKRKKDECPNTDMDFIRKKCKGASNEELITKDGCYKDQDQDGVHDCYDECPYTPFGTPVNENGCPQTNNE